MRSHTGLSIYLLRPAERFCGGVRGSSLRQNHKGSFEAKSSLGLSHSELTLKQSASRLPSEGPGLSSNSYGSSSVALYEEGSGNLLSLSRSVALVLLCRLYLPVVRKRSWRGRKAVDRLSMRLLYPAFTSHLVCLRGSVLSLGARRGDERGEEGWRRGEEEERREGGGGVEEGRREGRREGGGGVEEGRGEGRGGVETRGGRRGGGGERRRGDERGMVFVKEKGLVSAFRSLLDGSAVSSHGVAAGGRRRLAVLGLEWWRRCGSSPPRLLVGVQVRWRRDTRGERMGDGEVEEGIGG
ncbi:unnamed protein product [Boreogadus saida]